VLVAGVHIKRGLSTVVNIDIAQYMDALIKSQFRKMK